MFTVPHFAPAAPRLLGLHDGAVMSGERPGATPDDPMCPPALRSLIDACWSKEPHNRPTMEAVHDAVAAIPKIDRRSGMLSSPLP